MVDERKCCICGGKFACHFDGKPYCNKHYQRMRKYGSPEMPHRKRRNTYYETSDALVVITGNGDVILTDLEDRPLVEQASWCISKTGYAVANIGGKVVKMHRFLLGDSLKPDELVDHRNRNTLDNRRSNLRPCNHAENMRNVRTSRNNSVGHLGIRLTKDGKFNVRIVANRKEHHIGNYDSLEQAIIARQEAEDRYHGDFASHKSE